MRLQRIVHDMVAPPSLPFLPRARQAVPVVARHDLLVASTAAGAMSFASDTRAGRTETALLVTLNASSRGVSA